MIPESNQYVLRDILRFLATAEKVAGESEDPILMLANATLEVVKMHGLLSFPSFGVMKIVCRSSSAAKRT